MKKKTYYIKDKKIYRIDENSRGEFLYEVDKDDDIICICISAGDKIADLKKNYKGFKTLKEAL